MRTRNIVIGVIVVAALLACVAGLVVAWVVGRQAWGGSPMMPGWRPDMAMPHSRTMMGPLFLFLPLAGLLGLATVGGLLWLLFSGRSEPGAPGPATGHGAVETPLEILKRRYAAGEIDREEYERMRTDLES